jgi:hypothetical protein
MATVSKFSRQYKRWSTYHIVEVCLLVLSITEFSCGFKLARAVGEVFCFGTPLFCHKPLLSILTSATCLNHQFATCHLVSTLTFFIRENCVWEFGLWTKGRISFIVDDAISVNSEYHFFVLFKLSRAHPRESILFLVPLCFVTLVPMLRSAICFYFELVIRNFAILNKSISIALELLKKI